VIALDLAKAKNAPKTVGDLHPRQELRAEARADAVEAHAVLRQRHVHDADEDGAQARVKTIADMKGKSFSYAGYPECDKRITCILGFKKIYKLTQIKFVPIGTISVYTLLDQKKATAGDGFSTDPQQLQHNKYTALTDTKHVFGFQNVAPVVSKKLLSGSNGKLLASICNKVSSKLTLAAMQAMNKAYYVDKQTPKKIASQFLQANGLK
jgi:osmoprotectant transport system substrate-binding protein